MILDCFAMRQRETKDMQGWRHSHCLNVSGQSSQPDVQPLSHGEDLLEVCRDHLSLNSKPPVRCYGDAVLSPHGHDSPSVIGHNRLDEERERGEKSLDRTFHNTRLSMVESVQNV